VLLEAFDIDTLFQLSDGTEPVTAAGQPVGLMLDKGKGVGPNLITNSTFDNDVDDWEANQPTTILSHGEDGTLVFTRTEPTGAGGVVHYFPTVAGRYYRLTATLVSSTNFEDEGVMLRGGSTIAPIYHTFQAPGTASGVFKADGSSSVIYLRGTLGVNTWDNAEAREILGNHATQSVSPKRPTYQTSPARMTLDKVDDRLSVTVPTGGFTGTMVLATDQGTASYGVNIPAGPYDIGGRGGSYFPGNAIVGQLIRDGALSEGEAAATEAYFVENGATASYGAVTNFSRYWSNCIEITSFPIIDTSSGTNVNSAWFGCSSLTSFPIIDTSSVTNFNGSWVNCSSLTSFPLIDTSFGTFFSGAWQNCSSLTSFPLINTSSGAFFQNAWQNCSSLTSFPANIFDNIKAGNFTNAFVSTALTQTSIDNILVSLVASGIAAGTRVFNQSGGSAPSATGESAITTLRSRGWTVTVTGGF
jgi:hypothetical protein